MKPIALITGLLLLGMTAAASAETATTTTTGTGTGSTGAYANLSPGNQKIAQALYKAQTTSTTGTSTGTGTAPTTLTLDEIATMKTGGQGWGQVFHQMKSQGLVQDKNLGQVISRGNHTGKTGGATSTMVTTGSGRTTEVVTTHGHSAATHGTEATHGRGHGHSDLARSVSDSGRGGVSSHGSGVTHGGGSHGGATHGGGHR
jgi:hypothetical protein